MARYKHRYREVYKGVHIDLRAHSNKELLEKVNRKKKQIDGEAVDSNMLLSDWCDFWLMNYKKEQVSYSWYIDLERIIKNKIVPGMGDRAIGSVKPAHLQRFMNSQTHLSDSYVKKMHDILFQVFGRAYKNGLTSQDLSASWERPKGRDPEKRRSISDYERKHLLAVLKGHRGEVFVKLMLYTGLRPSEALALQWKDINLIEMTVTVNKSLKKTGEIGPTKSIAGNRVVPIPLHLRPLLKAHKGDPYSPVAHQLNGRRHTETSKKKLWANIKREMNISMGCKVHRNRIVPPYPLASNFQMYNLRHTFCTDLEKAGVPINIASRLMGHSDITLTSRIYTHSSTEALEIARACLDGQTSGQHQTKAFS